MSYKYIGNKTKIIDKLLPYFKRFAPPNGTVVDLMCGTGAVSEALKILGFKVISVDIMTFAVIHARVRLLARRAPAFSKIKLRGYKGVIDHLNSLSGIRGLFFKEYSPGGKPKNSRRPRKYFSTNNAKKIDAINKKINEWVSSGLLTPLEEAFLRQSLILAANKVANVAGTYGHYRSTWSPSALQPIELREVQFMKGNRKDHVVIRGAAESVASVIRADLCYIDPPYMKRQYAANYHILETLARGDRPEAIGESGLRPWRDQYSNFCSKVKIRESFEKIFKEMDCPKFLISYSEDGLLTKQELVRLFSKVGRVKIFSLTNKRFKSNSGGMGGQVTEYLFLVEKRRDW